MQNQWEDRGDHIAIFVPCRGETLETLIDRRDFHLVNSIPYSWYGRVDPKNGRIYTVASVRAEHKEYQTSLLLHRLIMGNPKNKFIDHENHNGLDNRRKNLRIVTNGENQQNRKQLRIDNKSGVTGVVWNKKLKKWLVQLKKNQNNCYFGMYESKAEATLVAMYARAIMFPYSEEARLLKETTEKIAEIESKFISKAEGVVANG